MKKFLSVLLVTTMLLSLCSCSLFGNNTQFTMGVLGSATNLDPIYASSDSEKIIATNCFEGLLRFDSKGRIDVGGITAYTVDKNALTYTFKLNPEAVWYVGEATKTLMESLDLNDFDARITADDYIYGIKRFIESGSAELDAIKGAKTYNPEDKKAVLGVEAVDEFTLKITLEKIDPDFLYKLAALPVFPCDKDFFEALDSVYCTTPATTLYNGPYYVKENSMSQTVIERNPEYMGNVQIENKTITLYSTGKASTLATRFKEGNYDIVVTPSTQKIDDYKASFTSNSSIWGLAFNCTSDNGSNAKIRDLLLSTIKYSEIEMPGFATGAAKSIIPGAFVTGDKIYSDLKPEELAYATDETKAQEKIDAILEEAQEEALAIKFTVPAEAEESAQKIVDNWQTLFGEKILFTLTTFEMSEINEITENSDYDLAILPLTPEKRTALGVMDALSGSPCFYTDKKLDTLKSSPKVSAEDNAKNYKDFEKLIVDNGVFVPLFYGSNDLYLKDNISGIYLADGGEKIYFHSGVLIEE